MSKLWPYTEDPYRAAWADVFRYAIGIDALLDAIAAKYGLHEVPPWTEADPVDPRMRRAIKDE